MIFFNNQGLELHFKNLESRLKFILNTETKNNREEQVKKVLRISTVEFLQRTLPEFKLLAEVSHHTVAA